MIDCAPSAIVCRPDEQKRLMVAEGTSTGIPARNELNRATFRPCDASGIAQPQRMSSSIAGSMPASLIAARMTSADSSTGCTDANPPSFFPRPTAVLTAAVMNTLSIYKSSLVNQ